MNRSLATAGSLRWRRFATQLASERIIPHNVIVGAGTFVAGGLGVAFQVLVSHRLQPADYGGVFAVITLITLIGLPASAFTLLMARETSRDRARATNLYSRALLSGGNRALLVAGLGIAALVGIISPAVAGFLGIHPELMLAAAAGIPFAFALPLLLGEFQGAQRFAAFAALLAGQAALKLIGALTLGSLFGPVGIIAGVSVGTALVYVVAALALRPGMSAQPSAPWLRPAANYLMIVLPSTLAISVLLSADVLVVKHYFSTRLAGEYAAVAALGRAIFWGAAGVAGVLFPKVTLRESQGRSGSFLIGVSVLVVALGGLIGVGALSLASTWLVSGFAGPAYVGAAGYLPWYALGMTFFGGASVVVATQQSRGTPGFLAVLLPLTLLEPTLLALFHQNLMQVVQTVDVSMALIFIGLAAQLALGGQPGGLAVGVVSPVDGDLRTIAQVK